MFHLINQRHRQAKIKYIINIYKNQIYFDHEIVIASMKQAVKKVRSADLHVIQLLTQQSTLLRFMRRFSLSTQSIFVNSFPGWEQ